jgi:glycosyltransferase A (GT-A) superfamily protein (DUF2064 family)
MISPGTETRSRSDHDPDHGLLDTAMSEIVIFMVEEHHNRCSHQSLARIFQQGSCALCSNMNRDSLILMSSVCGARRCVALGIALAPDSDVSSYTPYFSAGFSMYRQEGVSQGRRTVSVIHRARESGYGSVVLLMPGVPNLPPSYVERALTRLRDGSSLVLGPLRNGAFYLIGERTDAFGLLHGQVHLERELARSRPFSGHLLDRLQQAGVRSAVLPEWYRIRTVKDLRQLRSDARNGRGCQARWTQGASTTILDSC